MITLTSDMPHVDLESDPHYGYDSVEKFGEPWDAFIDTIDAEGTGCTLCEEGVAGSLEDDFTDDGHRWRLRWRWMTLVQIDGKVLPLCETCSVPLEPPPVTEDDQYESWKERNL